MTTPTGWVLAVDFGTTNTVAAVADARGTRTLNIDARQVTPSAVFLNRDRKTWLVGETAIRAARHRLQWFEPNPKRWVPDGEVFLGGVSVPVGDAIAALFRPITQEASAQYGGRRPDAFVVTHPAGWGEARVATLLRAAAAAAGRNWPAPEPLSEPVAAAQAILGMPEMPQQARLVVLDLGGGTVDATTVDRDGDVLRVAGEPQGRDGMGGEDYDQRLARWMTAEVGAPGLYDQLASSEDPDQRERAVEIRTDARNAKEQLSRQPAVPAQLPASPPELPEITPVLVSRRQLEELIGGGPGRPPGLTESVEVVSSVLGPLPPGPPFVGVFLTGGCSRIPMLGALVQQRTGMLPLTYDDPTTAVAQGAAKFAWMRLAEPAPPPPPPPEPPPPGPVAPKPRRKGKGKGKGTRRGVLLGVSLLAAGGLATGVALAAAHKPKPSPSPAPVPVVSTPVQSSPARAPSTSPPALTSSEQVLANLLNPNVLSNCTGHPDEETGSTVVALNCAAVSIGPTEQPLVEEVDVGTAGSWFTDNTTGFSSGGTCVDGDYDSTWNWRGSPAGDLGCTYSGGNLRIVWTIGGDYGVIAVGPATALWDWWQQNSCVFDTSC